VHRPLARLAPDDDHRFVFIGQEHDFVGIGVTVLLRLFELMVSVLGVVAWLAPFLWLVGAGPLWTLGRAHLVGHFAFWGGSIHTRPRVRVGASTLKQDWFHTYFGFSLLRGT
jgi:hypothetical protein